MPGVVGLLMAAALRPADVLGTTGGLPGAPIRSLSLPRAYFRPAVTIDFPGTGVADQQVARSATLDSTCPARRSICPVKGEQRWVV